jgi:serine/threonine protein phosphatase PrpC
MTLVAEVAGKTDVGCVRTNNEDNYGYDRRYGIFVVCDGMGGQAAGEVASKMGVDAVLNYFRQSAKNGTYPLIGERIPDISERGQALASAIQVANSAIHDAAGKKAGHAGMGSTIVAVLVKDNFFSVAHVGDSRGYLIRNGQIQQLTNDHSLVMEQVRRGLITREEAERSEIQNIIIRALGSEQTVEPDVDDQIAMPDDTLLLASDGLTKHVKDPDLLEIVSTSPSLEAACDRLIVTAKDRGGDDNITCVLVRMVEKSWYQLWAERLVHGRRPQWQSSC